MSDADRERRIQEIKQRLADLSAGNSMKNLIDQEIEKSELRREQRKLEQEMGEDHDDPRR
jgi:hypothetical protein